MRKMIAPILLDSSDAARLIRILLLCIVGWAIATMGYAQTTMPDLELKNLDGKKVTLSTLASPGTLSVISVWATWCGPCKKELSALQDLYEDWKEKYNVEIIAISVDNARALTKVKPMVAEKGWTFPVYIDVNQDVMRALSFQSIPQSFLVNGKGEIIYSHSGYLPGDELELEDRIREASK